MAKAKRPTPDPEKFKSLQGLFYDGMMDPDTSWSNPMVGAIKSDGGFFDQLKDQLYNSQANYDRILSGMAASDVAATPENIANVMDTHAQMMSKPFSSKMDIGGVQMNPLRNTGGALLANIKAHPLMAAGTGMNAFGNVSGLFDNDKIGGQVAGTALGALASLLLGKFGVNVSPLAAINIGMGGGNLGAMFDKLRAQKEQTPQPSAYY